MKRLKGESLQERTSVVISGLNKVFCQTNQKGVLRTPAIMGLKISDAKKRKEKFQVPTSEKVLVIPCSETPQISDISSLSVFIMMFRQTCLMVLQPLLSKCVSVVPSQSVWSGGKEYPPSGTMGAENRRERADLEGSFSFKHLGQGEET